MMPHIEAIINPHTVNSPTLMREAPPPTLPRLRGRIGWGLQRRQGGTEPGFPSFCCAGMVNLSLISNRTGIAVLLAAVTCFPLSAPTIAAARDPATGVASGPPPPAADPAIDEEASRLREAMRQEVPGLIADTPQREQAWAEQTQAALAGAGYKIDRPQLLV